VGSGPDPAGCIDFRTVADILRVLEGLGTSGQPHWASIMISMTRIARLVRSISAGLCYLAASVPAWATSDDLKGLMQVSFAAYLLKETRACGLTDDAVLASLKRTVSEHTRMQELRGQPTIILNMRTITIGDVCVHHANLEVVYWHPIHFAYNGSTFTRPVVIWRQDAMMSGTAGVRTGAD